MLEEIHFYGIEGTKMHRTESSAVYTLLGPDRGFGSEVIGSLDIHYPCVDRDFFSATVAIDADLDFDFDPDPSELANVLAKALSLPEMVLWEVRIWRIASGICDHNDPRVLGR